MNIKSFSFKEIFKKKRGVRTFDHFGSTSRKEKDWNILVLIIISLGALSSFWSVYLFFQVNSGSIFRSIDMKEEEVIVFDKSELDKKVLEIEKTQEAFILLRTQK